MARMLFVGGPLHGQVREWTGQPMNVQRPIDLSVVDSDPASNDVTLRASSKMALLRLQHVHRRRDDRTGDGRVAHHTAGRAEGRRRAVHSSRIEGVAMVSAVGIDLSLTATGVARSDGSCALFGKPGITNLAWATQLQILSDLRKQIVDYALDHHPDVAVIEGLDMAQSYGGQIQRSRLWCDVVQDLILDGLNVYVAPSPQVKMYATGKGALPAGRAGKKLVIEAVKRQWPIFEVGSDDNKADAAVMCAMACEIGGEPLSIVTPEQARGLAKTLSVYEVKV